MSPATPKGEAHSVEHGRDRSLKALLAKRWLSAHCVASGLVTLARDIVGTWEISVFPEAPEEWLEHPWNTEAGSWVGIGWHAGMELCP